jgi:hypothetical protein
MAQAITTRSVHRVVGLSLWERINGVCRTPKIGAIGGRAADVSKICKRSQALYECGGGVHPCDMPETENANRGAGFILVGRSNAALRALPPLNPEMRPPRTTDFGAAYLAMGSTASSIRRFSSALVTLMHVFSSAGKRGVNFAVAGPKRTQTTA